MRPAIEAELLIGELRSVTARLVIKQDLIYAFGAICDSRLVGGCSG